MSKSFITSRSDRILKEYKLTVSTVAGYSEVNKALSQDELISRVLALKEQKKNGTSTESFVVEALALGIEIGLRSLFQTPSESQLLASLSILNGKVAELQTGEGKSLSAALAAFVAALDSKGVHVMQCSEFLSLRDFQFFNRFFQYAGLTAGSLFAEQTADEKRRAYQCDVTYGTATDFAVDHLHDLLIKDGSPAIQRGQYFAIVDDAETSLIDDAYTILVISSTQTRSNPLPSTNVNKYIRCYEKLGALTGFANTDFQDFQDFYGLEMLHVISPEKSKRINAIDRIYKTEAEKLDGLVNLVVARHITLQPVLIHTSNSETAKKIADRFQVAGIQFSTLFGSNEAKDAFDIEDAGRPGAVTVVVKNAGFGQHIEVTQASLELGGLFVIAAERQESRRLDQKIATRNAVRGQIGTTAFFMSLEDSTMKLMASDKILKILEKNKFPKGKSLESEIVGNSIAIVQAKIERRNFSLRSKFQGV